MSDNSRADTVAVVVVSGVGNEHPGSGRDAIVQTLMADPDRRWTASTPGAVSLTAVAERGPADAAAGAAGQLRTGTDDEHREVFHVDTAHVTGRPDQTDVDVFEMYWADLSRAQGPLSRVFYLLMGITLQLSTIGLEAVRHYREHCGDSRLLRRLHRLMNVMSYWMVYAITPVTIAMITLLVLLSAQLLAPQVPDVVSTWVVGVLGAIAAGWIGGRIVRGGWTFQRPGTDRRVNAGRHIALIVATGVPAIAAVVLGIQSTSYRQFGYAVATALGILAVSILADMMLAIGPRGIDLAGRIAAIRIGFALCPLTAAVAATADAGPVRTANVLSALSLRLDRLVWLVLLAGCLLVACLALVVRHTGPPDQRDNRRRLSMSVIVTLVLGPVLFSIVTTGIFVFFSFLSRIWPGGYPTCWDARTVPADAAGSATCGAVESPLAPAGGILTTPDVPATTITHPVAWGNAMIREMAQPLGVTLLVGAVAVALILVVAVPYVLSLRRGGSLRPGSRPPTPAQTQAARQNARRQGRYFDMVVAAAGSEAAFVLGAIVWTGLTLAAAFAFWVFTSSWGSIGGVDMDQLSQDVGYWVVLALVVAAASAVGFQNVGVLRFLGRPLAVGMTAALDLVYDISSYLRIGQPGIVAPRIKMVARYRALLAHLRDAGYTRVVVCAHSQGTQLTFATLVGDENRQPPLAGARVLPERLEVVTYGSPLAQTYRGRLPGQFVRFGPPLPIPQLRRQMNLYRAGDYIGRGFLSHQYDPATPAIDGIFTERCLGTGQHTAYNKDERWRRVIRWVVTTPATRREDGAAVGVAETV